MRKVFFLLPLFDTVSHTHKKQTDTVAWPWANLSNNGMGILKSSVDKIFQIFFTTKPTSLGLSLSYDRITKGYGGELTVETKEGEGSVFLYTSPPKTAP